MPPAPDFRPAWWARNPHLQTVWGKLARRVRPAPTRTERWDTADGDFLDVVRLDADPARVDPARAPRLLLLHGLEGGAQSHYAHGMFAEAARRGWGMDLMLHRSCGPEMNRQRRFYHSGETSDAGMVLDRIAAEFPHAPLAACGVSLGGNQLVKYLGERGARVPATLRRAVAISVPYDLARGSRHIGRGFSRVYERHFLRSLVRKVETKLAAFPDLIAAERLPGVRTSSPLASHRTCTAAGPPSEQSGSAPAAYEQTSVSTTPVAVADPSAGSTLSVTSASETAPERIVVDTHVRSAS